MSIKLFIALLDVVIAMIVFVIVAIIVDSVWRKRARMGKKTRFEKYLSRAAVSFIFMGFAIMTILVLSILSPTAM